MNLPGRDRQSVEDRWHFDYPERLQAEPDEPRPVLWRWVALAVVLVVGAIWLAG